jgi:CRISPR-associated exonuclease Cas4
MEWSQWSLFPIDYKLEKSKPDENDKVQLSGQTLCLEEMLEDRRPIGTTMFYGRMRHRLDIAFDEVLRRETERAAGRVQDLIVFGVTPKPTYTKKAKSCSLMDQCLL